MMHGQRNIKKSPVVLVEEEYVERWKRLRLVWKEEYGNECRGR
jgi:hypothetical protein